MASSKGRGVEPGVDRSSIEVSLLEAGEKDATPDLPSSLGGNSKRAFCLESMSGGMLNPTLILRALSAWATIAASIVLL